MDLLIAATAHAHGARLYTRNAADFEGDQFVRIRTLRKRFDLIGIEK